jgi:hypothetical protein
VAPKAINTAQLADGAVTLLKLATEAQPLAVLGANAITVNTNNTLKQITVGESHSARVDNPHATTATQIDTQGGTNQLVARINAGTGVCSVSSEPPSSAASRRSEPRGRHGDVQQRHRSGIRRRRVVCAPRPRRRPTANLTLVATRTIRGRSVPQRNQSNTGKFRIFVKRNTGSRGPVAVRWAPSNPVGGHLHRHRSERRRTRRT